jgi:hypothetical protein
MMIKDRVKKITNQQGSELRKVLLTATSADDRSAKILERILDNKYFILDYMEDNDPPTPDFLKIIIELQSKLDQKTFTQLFVRVCGLYKSEDLAITAQMAKDAMEYFTETGDNTNGSLGLLGLIYHNNIALTDFKEDLLIRFEACYSHTISNFFKTLPLIKQHLIE